MPTRFYCTSESCAHAEKGPFVVELAQELIMDGNNLATIFCPRCGKPMRLLPADVRQKADNHRYYCQSEACGNEKGLFFIDLPSEAVLDEHNVATLFCPKCGKEMKSFDQMTHTVVNF